MEATLSDDQTVLARQVPPAVSCDMPRADKVLAAMRVNPAGDWRIGDVARLCRRHGLGCMAPRRGDHYKVSHAALAEILTIPAARPIKPVYIRRLVAMVEAVMRNLNEQEDRHRGLSGAVAQVVARPWARAGWPRRRTCPAACRTAARRPRRSSMSGAPSDPGSRRPKSWGRAVRRSVALVPATTRPNPDHGIARTQRRRRGVETSPPGPPRRAARWRGGIRPRGQRET